MGAACPVCGAPREVGVLCGTCAGALPSCEGLIPDHVTSREPDELTGWVIDAFGTPHALGADPISVGRRAGLDLVILNGSVSRDHAEISNTSGEWVVRDLGSRNWTQVDGRRVQGRATLSNRVQVRFGDAAFYFIADPVPMPQVSSSSLETAHAAGSGTFRYTLRGPEIELCVLGSAAASDAGGAVLIRTGAADETWKELSLPPLEFHLLRVLCSRAIEDADSPSKSRGCVPTKQLAKLLPFQSKYANEENVRQVVRRVRATLKKVGVDNLVEAAPGRGYYVAWTTSLG